MRARAHLVFILPLICMSCVTSHGIPTVDFVEYASADGSSAQTQTKKDVAITVETIRPSDMYEYPQYFSFNLERLPQELRDNIVVDKTYQPTYQGRSWEYVFADPNARYPIAVFRIKIDNNTGHIIRMKDSRVYLVKEGADPIAAIAGFPQLRDMIAAHEMEYAEPVQGLVLAMDYPFGLFPAILDQNRSSFKLINNVEQEILPGYSLEGLLVFPSIISYEQDATLSLFDITTATDPAGNPAEKTRFDFPFAAQPATMWLDRSTKMWKKGKPPLAEQ